MSPPRRRRQLPFTRFVREVLHTVPMTPAQRVLYRVAADGIDPIDLPPDERELARTLFGDVDRIPAAARTVRAMRKGARVGGTYFGALHLLHAGLTLPLAGLAPGEAAAGVIVAPDLRLARQALRYISGAVAATPTLAALVVSESTDSLMLRRADGVLIEFLCLPATRGGSAVRSRSTFGVLLDEASFFYDADYVANDREVYRALVARLVLGAPLWLVSTVWGTTDLLTELYQKNVGNPSTALAILAPTLLMRDDAHTRQLVESERERDPENAAREFDCVPLSDAATAFFATSAIDAALAKGQDITMPEYGAPVVLGLDCAFRKDPTAGVIVTRDRAGLVIVKDIIEIKPVKGAPLVPSAVIKELVARAIEAGATALIADQHYIESAREHADSLRVIEAPGGQEGKIAVHLRCRSALAEGNVAIKPEHARLAAQLRQIVSKPTPGGGLSISSPRRGSSHGDVASAWTLAAWYLIGAQKRTLDVAPPLETQKSRERAGYSPKRRIKGAGY